jgi:regulator of RNase E activity RraA
LDQTLLCGDVSVSPGDLVLGAEDGILIVPQAYIDDVVREAYEKSLTESRVRVALRDGMSPAEAYRRFGVM